MGLMSSLPIFWSLAASRLSGKAGGTAIAIVNSAGAVGAFAGPYAMGWLFDLTHHYIAGLWAIAACLAVGAIMTWNAASSSRSKMNLHDTPVRPRNLRGPGAFPRL